MRVRVAAIGIAAAVGGALLAPAVPFAEDTPAPPVAALDPPSFTIEAGKTLELDASKSTPGATPLAGYVWDLDGDGRFETNTRGVPVADVTPLASGTLKVRVRVFNAGGQSSDAESVLTVTAPPKAGGVSVSSGPGVGSADDAGDAAGGSDPATADPDPAADTASGADPAAGPAAVTGSDPAEAAPGPAAATLTTAQVSSTPDLVPRHSLAVRASAQGETEPVADVHAAAASSVTIKDFKFSPDPVNVKVGDTITWTNQDDAPHTATASDGSFDTGTLNKGKSGSHTFDKTGTFAYICSIHPSMHGTVTVAAASGSSDGGSSGGTSPTTSSGSDSGSDLPTTGFDLLAVVLIATALMGTGALLRRRTG